MPALRELQNFSKISAEEGFVQNKDIEAENESMSRTTLSCAKLYIGVASILTSPQTTHVPV